MLKIIMSDTYKSVAISYDLENHVYLVYTHGPNGQISVHESTPAFVAKDLLRRSINAYNAGDITAGDELSGYACDIANYNHLDIDDLGDLPQASYEAYQRAIVAEEPMM